jgi:chromatin modification-related protein VID21
VNGVQSATQLNASANALAGASRLNLPGQLAVPASARQARLPMQAPVAGMGGVPAQMAGGLVPPIPMNAMPQAQLQALQAQAQHRLSMSGGQQPNINLLMQARQIQDQQRHAVQQLQQQQQQQLQQQQVHQQPSHLSSSPQAQMSAQQATFAMSQGAQAAQLAQMAQMSQPSPLPAQINGVSQPSPNGVRTAMNGLNQPNYLNNAQALMGGPPFGAVNGTGMASSPVAGMGVGSVTLGSPRLNSLHPDKYPAYAAQIAEVENAIRAKNPGLPPDQARHLAHEHLARIIVQKRQQMNQSAMNAAAGGAMPQGLANGLPNGMGASTSPHQYAQMLRAQQQLQAGQNGQQQQQQQSAPPPPSQQQQRNSTGSVASATGK